MSRYLVELRSPYDWQCRLGDPEAHWKRGASALELAANWMRERGSSRQIPPEVADLLDAVPALAGASLRIAIPELRTRLDTSRAPSQTDLWALLVSPSGSIGLAVEGKAREPFGDTVDGWLQPNGARNPRGRLSRLAFLSEHLGLNPDATHDLRYQLLHRTVACLLEAAAWGADAAVMLVQRFCLHPSEPAQSWSDFEAFAARFGVAARPGNLVQVPVPRDLPLYLGWLDCRLATDQELLTTMVASDAAGLKRKPVGAKAE